jgi:hypothetical protein
VTATTLSAQQTGHAGLGKCGGDAQERAATNPVAALPCARTPCLPPSLSPCLSPCSSPHQRPWGWTRPSERRLGW